MRVLLAGHIGQPFGGIATYCEALLNSKGTPNVDLHFVETSKGAGIAARRGKWRIPNYLNALENIIRFIAAVLRERPDVIHIMTAMMPSLLKHGIMVLAARLIGVKVILQPHCSPGTIFRTDRELATRFAEYVFRRCDGILVLSREWLALNAEFQQKLRYLPNGIDLTPYNSIPPRRPDQGVHRVNILYLGYLGPEKGTFDLLNAVKILKQEIPGWFEFNLVGEGFTAAVGRELLSAIRLSGLEDLVCVHMPVYGQEKYSMLAAADIYTLPSHHEGMPISIIEAMASALPVIATSVGGIPDLITNDFNGLLVEAGDHKALAVALRRLIESPAQRLKFGSEARRTAEERCNINDIIPELMRYYNQIASGKPT